MCLAMLDGLLSGIGHRRRKSAMGFEIDGDVTCNGVRRCSGRTTLTRFKPKARQAGTWLFPSSSWVYLTMKPRSGRLTIYLI